MEVYVVHYLGLLDYDDEVAGVIGVYTTASKANEVVDRFHKSSYFRQSLLSEDKKRRLQSDWDEGWDVCVDIYELDKQPSFCKDEVYIPCDE